MTGVFVTLEGAQHGSPGFVDQLYHIVYQHVVSQQLLVEDRNAHSSQIRVTGLIFIPKREPADLEPDMTCHLFVEP